MRDRARITEISPAKYSELLIRNNIRGLYFQNEWHLAVAYPAKYSVRYLLADINGVSFCVLPIFKKQLLGLSVLGSPLPGCHTEYTGPVLLVGELRDGEASQVARGFVYHMKRSSVVHFNLTFNHFNCDPSYLRLIGEFDYLLPSLKNYEMSGVIDLYEGVDRVFEGFEGRLRTDIRKAIRNGVTVEMIRGETIGERIDVFYQVLNAAFYRRGLSPRHPKSLFDSISKIRTADPKFFFAVLGGKVVATSLTIKDGNRVIYFAGGATPDGLKNSASSLIQMKSIESAIDDGAKLYDVGGFGDGGIDKFKRSLASSEYSRVLFKYQNAVFKKALEVYLKVRGLN